MLCLSSGLSRRKLTLGYLQVIEEYAKFSLLLKLRRGIEEEKFRVEVNKNTHGKFYLSQFEQDNS